MSEIIYDDLVNEIRKFKGSSLVTACSEALWSIWTAPFNNKSITSDNNIEIHTIRAYAPRIAAICLATANEYRDRIANQHDVRTLCDLFVNVTEAFDSEQNKFQVDYIDKLKVCLANSSSLKKYASADEETIKISSTFLFVSRLLNSQWEHVTYDFSDVSRNWAIVNKFSDITSKYKRELDKFLDNNTLEDLIRHSFALYALGFNNNGFINLKPTTFDNVSNDWKLDFNKLKFTANSICCEATCFKDWHNDVKKIDLYYRKYFPLPFPKTPLLRCNETLHYFLCISPWHILWCMRELCFNYILSVTKTEQEKQEVLIEFGEATQKYFLYAIKSICNKDSTIIDLNTIEELSSQKKGDFLLIENHTAIIVEVKRTISNYITDTLVLPDDVVKMWDKKILKAFTQCASTVKYIKSKEEFKNIKRIVVIICVKQNLIKGQFQFLEFAYRTGIFKEMDIQYAAIATISEVENNLSKIGIDGYASKIIKRIEHKDGAESNFIDLKLPHLKRYEDLLFPTFTQGTR